MGHGSTFAEVIAKIKVTYLFLDIRVLFFKKSLALSSLARSSAHMSAERSGNGAERAENGVSGSGAVSGHSRKRLSVRLSVERDRGRRAESECHKNRPLTLPSHAPLDLQNVVLTLSMLILVMRSIVWVLICENT